jgi:dTMP kinase
MSERGRFIVFEGIDGSGTTTQTERLVSWLCETGSAIQTAEPTDSEFGRLLRRVLKGDVPAPAATTALMFAADRVDHMDRKIEPTLASGTHVVSDRYVVSSFAYQGSLLDLSFVKEINSLARTPDLTIFLRVSAEIAMERIARSRTERDAYEHLEFQREVAQSYERSILEPEAGRVEILDGQQHPDDITSQVRALVSSLL